jgi:integrase
MASGTVNKRERSLTDDELRRVWVACDGVGIFGSMVRLLLLTCGRRMEVAGMRRSELSGSDWLLPKTRNKVKEDLLRPLTENAIAILRSIPRFENSDKVFTLDGTRSFGDFARRLKQLHEISGISGWTIHDLRRTARGLLSKAGVQPHVAELCLGHKIKGVAGVYDHRSHYYPQLVLAFRLLAREIDKVVDLQGVAEPADNNVVGNVLPMRA